MGRRAKSWRRRRSAYSSGRKELIGFESSKRRKTRKVKKKSKSALDYTPFKGVFRWRRY